ncbi:MAG: MarR family transcriptional regulator [Actinobacteria bacterium]|nr:MarR family transcriptional regulator [Actinomycetota bacterium]
MTDEININRTLAVFNKIGKVFASLESFSGDLSLSKLEILTLDLIFKEEELIMSKIAKGLDISFSTVTGIIDRLIEKKLVKRERNGGDRRIVRVKLTKKGKEGLLIYRQEQKKIMTSIMNILTRKEQEDFICILEKIINVTESERKEIVESE